MIGYRVTQVFPHGFKQSGVGLFAIFKPKKKTQAEDLGFAKRKFVSGPISNRVKTKKP